MRHCPTPRPAWPRNRLRIFFSSRRRHTRYWRDWRTCALPISDDYAAQTRAYFQPGAGQVLVEQRVLDRHYQPLDGEASTYHTRAPCGARTEVERTVRPLHTHWRSEERRVGKECRSRWSPYN